MSPSAHEAADGTGGAPQTRAVASALDVEADRLQHFVTFHPEPSAHAVIAMADCAVDAETRGLVEDWLASETCRANRQEGLNDDEREMLATIRDNFQEVRGGS